MSIPRTVQLYARNQLCLTNSKIWRLCFKIDQYVPKHRPIYNADDATTSPANGRQIDTVIRKSHSEQISWLESKLAIPLTKDLDIWPDFAEICERRNLITHTGGLISEQYIKICREYGCTVEEKQIGQAVAIDAQYYEHAVAVILEFGMKLVQVVW